MAYTGGTHLEIMFRRIGNLFRGFLSLFVSGLERKNPEALLEVEKENLRKQIGKYNEGLAAHAGLCEKLIAQVRRLERDHDELRAKITANLKAGNQELAGQMAMRFQSVKQELADNRSQLEDAEKTYKELISVRDTSIKEARKRIDEITRGLNEVKIKQATAELNEMASGMVTEMGGGGETLSRLHEIVEEERTKASGRARVAKDAIDTTQYTALAAEQKALEQMALADFAAAEGLAIEGAAGGSAPAPAVERSMGQQEGQ
jgi:phage shock protein A